MKKPIFYGCGTAIATPFDDSLKINYSVLKKFLDFQIDNKVDAIIVCGTTGESATLSTEEKKELIKFTCDYVSKRVPVIAGTGSNNTLACIELSKFAQSVGADGLLIVTPYYNKTTQKGLIEHYSQIAQSVSIPIIMYNVPSRTGLNIEPSTCLELSKIDNIVAIKEASGNLSQIAKIYALCRDSLYIYSGNDDQILPVLSVGGIGVISVLSNIKPLLVHNIVENYLAGNTKLAKSEFLNNLELANSLFCEVNPIPVKYALSKIGFNFGKPRLPLIELLNKKSIDEFFK